MFVEMPPRYDGQSSFVDMLNEAKVSITEHPLDAYELDDEDDGEEFDNGVAYGQDAVEDIDEEAFDEAKGKKR
jgi:hypothetical protein